MTMFRTQDVGNRGAVLYQLSVRDPSQAFADLMTYTFPLSPSSIRSEPNALSTYSDTQGTSMQSGVSRVMDTYGLAPPVFTIEGTTGWDRHSTDGYVLDGLQSIILLRNFIDTYVQMNQQQREAGNPNLFALEFYDYFTSQYWQVEPVGPQVIRQTNDRPLLSFYRFRLAAICPVRLTAAGIEDYLLSIMNVPILQSVVVATQSLTTMLGAYGPAGITAALG